MSHMRHHAIVVTAPENIVETAHAKAVECGLTVTPFVDSPVNGYATFLVVPDGSKEGWAESDKGDTDRAVFIAWLDRQRWEDGSTPYEWVSLFYGDHDAGAEIERHDGDWFIDDGIDYDGPHDLDAAVAFVAAVKG